MNGQRDPRGLRAGTALPLGFTMLLMIGALAAGLNGRLPALGVLAGACAVVTVLSAAAQPACAPVLALIGWCTVIGFSARPYAQLRPAGWVAERAALALAACCLAGAAAGWLMRWYAASFTLRIVDDSGLRPGPAGYPRHSLPGGLHRRRQAAGIALAVAVLPLLTWGLGADPRHLTLADDLLIYLVAVVAIAIVGGFWPAVLAAVAASLLLNWYFTPPVHTFTIGEPRNLLALLLFVTVAVTVSSVVHLAARRAAQAARSSEEAASLLVLAQTVLSGTDTPAAILDHLTGTLGGRAELLERVGGQWVPVAVSGIAPGDARPLIVQVRDDLRLDVAGQAGPSSARLIDGFAAQAAAGLDRERLRTQAAQAEALAEGNRMRTALLAAVSHDLRTPLASIKASVSTLRQADVDWAPEDEAALLATIEESADRLDALIGNLLDMSRLATGSLEPFLRPAAIDEVVPVALGGLDAGMTVRIVVPDELPLVRTDPGLLERILANLFANALRYSPPGRSPQMRASQVGESVVLEVIDYGRGVPDEHKPRIFEPFERLGERGSGTGVGLGLAVAMGFAEAMGAALTAADTAGGGLTMRITLPVAAGEAVRVSEP